MKKLFTFLALLICLSSFAQTLNIGQGANNVTIGSTGVVCNGSATMWNDVVVNAFQTRVSPVTSLPALSLDSIALLFVRDADSSEVAYYSIQIPHTITYGTSAKCNPHCHYMQYSAADTTFVFSLWYRIHKINGRSGNWTRLTKVANSYLTYTSAPFQNILEFHDVPLVNVSESSYIDFKIYRTDAAGNPATLYVKGFDVHFEISKFGTPEEYPSH